MLILFLSLFSRYLDVKKTEDLRNRNDRWVPCLKNAPNATKNFRAFILYNTVVPVFGPTHNTP
jgi:hypothetical protein